MDIYQITRNRMSSGGPIPAIFITGIVILIVFIVTIILLSHFGIIKGGSMVNRMAFTNKYKSRKQKMH